MAKQRSQRKQFILRLDPNDSVEAQLIARLERAAQTWGGVQRVLKEALQQYAEEGQGRRMPPLESTPEPPTSLVDAIVHANPGVTLHAAQAMASSEPLRNVRALYTALDAFTPDSLTETEALLLRELQTRIETLLREAAQRRQPIRQILNQE